MNIRLIFLCLALVFTSPLRAINTWSEEMNFPPAVNGSDKVAVTYDAITGIGIAVWIDTAMYHVYASTFDSFGATWSTAILLGTSVSGGYPCIDSQFDGSYTRAIAAWPGADAMYYSIYSSQLEEWGTPSALSNTIGSAEYTPPVIGISYSGAAILSYQSNDSPNQIYGVDTSDDFTDMAWPTWNDQVQLSSDMVAPNSYPSLTVNKKEGLTDYYGLVVWSQGYSGSNILYGVSYLFGTGWGSPVELTSSLPYGFAPPISVCIDPSSNYGMAGISTYNSEGELSLAYSLVFGPTSGWVATPIELSAVSVTDYVQVALLNNTPILALGADLSYPPTIEVYTGTFTTGMSPSVTWTETPVFTGAKGGTITGLSYTDDFTAVLYWADLSSPPGIGTAFYNGSAWTEDNIASNTVALSPQAISMSYGSGETQGIGVWYTSDYTNSMAYALFNLGAPPPPPPPPPGPPPPPPPPGPPPPPPPSSNQHSYHRPNTRR